VLFVADADAMEVTPEGSPILLAEKRTLSFADGKIVLGSTRCTSDRLAGFRPDVVILATGSVPARQSAALSTQHRTALGPAPRGGPM